MAYAERLYKAAVKKILNFEHAHKEANSQTVGSRKHAGLAPNEYECFL